MFSYVDSSEIVPYSFKTSVKIDREAKEDKEVIYNHKEGFMLSKGEKYKILPRTQDPLSLIFYLMKERFSLGQLFELNLNSNQSNYGIKVKVKDKKTFRIQNKDYLVWELTLSARRIKGENRHSLDASAYFLETPAINIPLLIKASTNMGGVTFRLENLN